MLPGKVMHSNVFEIRKHAERYQNDNVVKYCNQFIQVKENANLLKKYVEDEIAAVKDKLVELEKYLGNERGESDGKDSGDYLEHNFGDGVGAKEALEMELEDWKARLKELNMKEVNKKR
ncbi:hypothetical protein BGX24_004400 [Mortierella sp. AD032]|nr:hypothetical protein BGX24_004400 [Mortierella sp. AD032]